MSSTPSAAWFAAFSESVQTELPHVRKTGRYAFFVVCAWGAGISVGAIPYALGIHHGAEHSLATVVSIATFLALREMSKSWDLALHAAAQAIEAAVADKTPKSGLAEGESAVAESDASNA